MNINYIEDFIKVAETKSINQASQLLNISAPALSKRMKHIENHFNCNLFYRTSRGIFLTENGKIVLEDFKTITQTIKSLKLKIQNTECKNMRMGMLPSFSLYKLENTKDKLLHTNIDIKIENTTQVLLTHLYNGDIDVVIGDISSLENTRLSYETLYTEKYIVIFHKNEFLNSKREILIDDLVNYKLFLLSPPCDTLSFINSNFSDLSLDIEHKESLESIFANVKTGQGITIVPQSLSPRIESMNLSSTYLANYKREVGLIAYNRNLIEKISTVLPPNFIDIIE
jgi:DNA-binding transcriptional LysR family regulator